MDLKTLFQQTNLGCLTLKNRFFRASTHERLASEDGHLTPELWEVYRELAEGGVGTILTGYAHILPEEQPNARMLGIYDESFLTDYHHLTDMVHGYDAKIIMQIVYGGSATGLMPPSSRIWGPSAVQHPSTGVTPAEMTHDDIRELTRAFAAAALRVKLSGFDGVELHAAHGYLLSQFLTPFYNRREDEYGGCIENRARLHCEIIDAVRKAVGPNFPILIKINAADYMENGLTEADSLTAARLMVPHGLDAVEVSGGNFWSIRLRSRGDESFYRGYAADLAGSVSVPVILTGGNRHCDVMEEILNTSDVAYFGLSRPLISEPNLIDKWKADPEYDPQCRSCGRCYSAADRPCILH